MKYDIFLDSFRQFVADTPEEELQDDRKYVFLSDMHMGNGGGRDDLAINRHLVEDMLEHWYLPNGYYLILNGDIEDLNKFPLFAIRKAWKHLLELFDAFDRAGRLRKICGNHDLELMAQRDYPWEVRQGLMYRYGNNRIFVFHGHQASNLYVNYKRISSFLIRWVVKPLHIRNSGLSKNPRKRFAKERRIYQAARALGLVAITGHTHRPLFESLSKYDNVRFTLERLLDEFLDAENGRKEALQKEICLYRDELYRLANAKEKEKKTQSLYDDGPFLIPCLFNSGCATGKNGLNVLEITEGTIALMYWTSREHSHPYIEKEALESIAAGERSQRHTLHKARLASIFTRIELLGENSTPDCPER
ncbi:MAG: serine/threonine protein phosphatase [Treponema sp.]|nr:MAG: serine/threonine protein phosphatase [Treponema sp.]